MKREQTPNFVRLQNKHDVSDTELCKVHKLESIQISIHNY